MHSDIHEDYVFFHNGGFDGDVTIRNRKTEQEFTVPMEDLKSFMVKYVRNTVVERLEKLNDDEMLLGGYKGR